MLKRLLCCASSMDLGGAETFLMKQYRQLDREKYQMDFCVNSEKEGAYDREIESLGGRIYRIPSKSENLSRSLKALKIIVRDNGYERVLVNSVKPGTSLELLAAKAGGAKHLIYRSSNTQVNGGTKQKLLHSTIGLLAHIVPTVKIAPSTPAAEFCFGKNCVKKQKAILLPNAIDTRVYRYSEESRKETREMLGLGNSFILLHIGRFTRQKNHGFLLDIFNELLKLEPDSALLLIGSGEDENKIKARSDAYGFGDRAIFLGNRTDVPQLMCAADCFVLPSLFEGMPNTVIEAQACALPCIVSSNVTREAKITPLAEYAEPDDPASWAEAALKYKGAERTDTSALIKAAGYGIEDVSAKFVELCFG